MFNADAFAVELGAPQLQLEGRRYLGRVLSFEEFTPFEERFAKLEADFQTQPRAAWKAAFNALAADYLHTVFPPPGSWWRRIWWRDPVPRMLAHPGLLRGLRDFFRIQVRAIKLMMGVPDQKAPDGSDSALKIVAG